MTDEKQDTDSRDPGLGAPAPSSEDGKRTESLSGEPRDAIEDALIHARGEAERLAAEVAKLEATITATTRFCSVCQTNVEPNKKGQCPKGHFLPLNFVARKHIANVARREQYLAENIAEYQPNTLQLRDACRLLANVRERLDTIREGTPEHSRLLDDWTKLIATLEASRASRSTHETADLEHLNPDQIVARAERLLETARLVARRSTPEPAPGPGSEAPDRETEAVGASTSDFSASPLIGLGPDSRPLSEATTPEPTCEYCRQPFARCAEIKSTRLDAWRALHYDDPTEVERRDDLATAEMYESFRRQRTGDPNVR